MKTLTTINNHKMFIRDEWESDALVIGEANINIYRIMPQHFTGDKVFLDLGANIGAQSLLVSSMVPDARIIAFEPQPDNFELLKKNMEVNDEKFELDDRGVWHESGETKIHNRGGGSYTGDDGRDEIELITIEDIFEEYNLDEVSVLKVDIEQQNAEKLLINTPIELLKKCGYICVEFDGWNGSDKTLLGKLVKHLSPYFNIEKVGNEETGGDLWATRK